MKPKAQKSLPEKGVKVLLHSCCAPCSGSIIENMHEAGLDLTIYFYNPNIHPEKEYMMRKSETIRYAKKMEIPFIDADYDTDNWFESAKGHEMDPERGQRCSMCFEMRLVKTARYASENDFKHIASCLGISRWKNFDQVVEAGKKAALLFPDITYLEYNWRKKGGTQRMYEIAKKENFYAQQYCGCVYSLRDTNKYREKMGREKIKLGEDFYET